jgi:hypothetical protein
MYRKTNIHTFTGFIRGILRGVRYAKSLRVLFLHRRSPSWTTLVLYSRVVFIFNEPTNWLHTNCTVTLQPIYSRKQSFLTTFHKRTNNHFYDFLFSTITSPQPFPLAVAVICQCQFILSHVVFFHPPGTCKIKSHSNRCIYYTIIYYLILRHSFYIQCS